MIVRRSAMLLALALAAGPGASAQERSGRADESLLLREAATLEASGDLDGAVGRLEELLARHPTSSGGLFALERVLRGKGTPERILPAADRFLESDPRSGAARLLKLRVMVELDSLETLEAEARRWIRADPRSPEAYREVARIYDRVFGPQRALVVLREGRRALGDSTALAVEIGGALLDLGRNDEAVAEWSRSVGPEGGQMATVLRRVGDTEGDPTPLASALVAALDADPTTADRRRAAVGVALEFGLFDEAWKVAERVLPDLPPNGRRAFLTDLARRGEEIGAPTVALGAFRRLREMSEDDRERRALDVRIAGAALAVGDRETAREAEERLARDLPAGSAEKRRVMADLLRLEAPGSTPDLLTRRLAAFRAEFPDAPELDELASVTAAALQSKGEPEAAQRVLAGVAGPHASLERAYLLLEVGDVPAGKEALTDALRGLPPTEATSVIQLVGLLSRLGPGGGTLVAALAVRAHRGILEEGLDGLEESLEAVQAEDQAAVLAQAARLADDAGLAERGAALRERLISLRPEAPETGDAMLALARYRAGREGEVEEAVRLLETLILQRPNAAVVPAARRELERLRRGSEGAG